MGKEDDIPEPSPQEKKEAEKKIEDWLKDKGYPSPDPKKQ